MNEKQINQFKAERTALICEILKKLNLINYKIKVLYDDNNFIKLKIKGYFIDILEDEIEIKKEDNRYKNKEKRIFIGRIKDIEKLKGGLK